jgi:hypothetical protein
MVWMITVCCLFITMSTAALDPSIIQFTDSYELDPSDSVSLELVLLM